MSIKLTFLWMFQLIETTLQFFLIFTFPTFISVLAMLFTHHPTCLCYCSGHNEVEDHHHAVTSENLCEGGRMGPVLWTLEHWENDKVTVQIINISNLCMFSKLTSSHWPRECGSFGWGSSITLWWASLQWRRPSGWHAFKKGFYNTYVILVIIILAASMHMKCRLRTS